MSRASWSATPLRLNYPDRLRLICGAAFGKIADLPTLRPELTPASRTIDLAGGSFLAMTDDPLRHSWQPVAIPDELKEGILRE